MTEDSSSRFWERSWDAFDPSRVAAYLQGMEVSADPILDYVKRWGARTVCDAGCGCGAYMWKLASAGFQVSGFDVSARAVELTKALLDGVGFSRGIFRTADIAATGYPDGAFDAVVSRDVIDHLSWKYGVAAVKELYRITADGGCLILTLDGADEEYESQPHVLSEDGDYRFIHGK